MNSSNWLIGSADSIVFEKINITYFLYFIILKGKFDFYWSIARSMKSVELLYLTIYLVWLYHLPFS